MFKETNTANYSARLTCTVSFLFWIGTLSTLILNIVLKMSIVIGDFRIFIVYIQALLVFCIDNICFQIKGVSLL